VTEAQTARFADTKKPVGNLTNERRRVQMSGILGEWIIVLSFFLFVVGFTIVEAVWLNRIG